MVFLQYMRVGEARLASLLLSHTILYNWKGGFILFTLQRQQRRALLATHKGSTEKGIQCRKESISRED